MGAARRLSAALSRGLYRTLAEDDDRAAYWVRHVRHGVVLSELSSAAALAYVLLDPTSPGPHPVVLGLAVFVVVAAPLLLLLPLAAMMRDRRGPLFFYASSIAVTAVVSTVTRLDGGHHSPLYALLVITLGFMAATYPPYGVAAMGSVMTASYLLVVSVPDVDTAALFTAGVMAMNTVLCVMVSANSWAAYDRQVELLRSQRLLAATDELTGGPNRRAFLDRLAVALEDAGRGHPAVVCLVDLDGFKAVDDRNGHLAGDAVLKGAALAERLRAAVSDRAAAHGVTASVGLATPEPADDVEAVLHRADEAMYRAKSAGGTGPTSRTAERRSSRSRGPASDLPRAGRADPPVRRPTLTLSDIARLTITLVGRVLAGCDRRWC